MSPQRSQNTRPNQGGFSLVELMIAMAIGVVLVGGALAVHIQSHDAHTFSERMARLQENGRFAFDLMAPDVRLAGYWGRTDLPSMIERRTGDTANPLPATATPANNCYAGYHANVMVRIEAADQDQSGVDNPYRTCIADASRMTGTDILIVRHASAVATAPADIVTGRLYLISNVVHAELFVGGSMPIPAGYGSTDTIHELITNAYFVSPNSSAGNGVPALNRLQLGVGPSLVVQELIPGVEDLQVQLGIDTDADGSVNSYVSPDSLALAGATVVAARTWIRFRGERVDVDFTDDATYEYADLQVQPNDSYRRLLLSRTLRFRNEAS